MASQWSSLSRIQRRLIVAAAVSEAVLKALMLLDLKHRSAEEVRGPRWLWALSSLVNTAGLGPIIYFVKGRLPRVAAVDEEPSPGAG